MASRRWRSHSQRSSLFPAGRLVFAPTFDVRPGGYLARIRTLNKRSRISCVTVTPRGKNGAGGHHCIASRISVKQQLAQFCIPVILRALKCASVAQLVEQKTLNLLVEGSNPSGGTTLRAAATTQQARSGNEKCGVPPPVFALHFVSMARPLADRSDRSDASDSSDVSFFCGLCSLSGSTTAAAGAAGAASARPTSAAAAVRTGSASMNGIVERLIGRRGEST